MIYHNSFLEQYRNPTGAVRDGTSVRIFLSSDEEFDKSYIRIWSYEKNEELYRMDRTEGGFQIDIKPTDPGLLWYYFILFKGDKESFYCCRDGYTGGEGIEIINAKNSFQITVYDKDLSTPEWFRDTILYQIFPDRFNREGDIEEVYDGRIIHLNWNDMPLYSNNGSNNYDFFGGNFKGIKEKLEFLSGLGIGAVYLNPIFESSSNHRYDTGDYMKTDYMLGNEDDFYDLVKEADRYGIKIILDGVFNHTGSDSRYFNKLSRYNSLGAYQSKESPYYSWYKFKSFPKEYECWWDIDTLPDINENEESFKEFIYKGKNSVVSKWMDMGVMGWRLDVADELPDEFIEEFKKSIKDKDKEAVLIGEVWEDASNKVSYNKPRNYVFGKQFDSFMNYPLRNLLIDFLSFGHDEEGIPHRCIDASEFNLKLLNLYNNYPKDIFYSLMNFLSSHDTNRIMTIFEGWLNEKTLTKAAQSNYIPSEEQIKLGKKRLMAAWAFIIAFPGVPCIFYGDETGLEGYKDPFNRRTYPWGNLNEELIGFFKKMNCLRKENNELIDGEFLPLYAKDDIYMFQRSLDSDAIIFGMNRSIKDRKTVSVNSEESYVNIENGDITRCDNGILKIEFEPLSYIILKKIS